MTTSTEREPLTPMERLVFNRTRLYIAEHGHPPTLPELADEMGLTGAAADLQALAQDLQALRRKGWIRQDGARSFTLVDPDITGGTSD